jgi:hypothetical protein
VYSDSDFRGDKDGRKSVSGSIIMVSGVPLENQKNRAPFLFLVQRQNTLLYQKL